MTKNFLSWMATGLAAILVSALQYFTSGNPIDIKTVLTLIGTGLLVRAANWVVATWGPEPTA